MNKDNIFIEESEKLINSSEINEKQYEKNGITISEIEVNSKLSKTINRNKGKYITITYKEEMLPNKVEELIDIIKTSINNILKYLKLSNKSKVLFVGLGNKEITSDKFGYLVIEKIAVSNKYYKIYKDVEGITNIKSKDFIKAISTLLKVDLIVVFDALECEHLKRLGTTIQISSGGLVPANEKKNEISKKTMNTEVISIGLPTVINIKNIKKESKDLLISKKDIDILVDDISSIISIVINRIF